MKEGEYTKEWGGNVRFLDPSHVSLRDADGNEIKTKCKCGEKATAFVFGKESYRGWCADCYYKATKETK